MNFAENQQINNGKAEAVVAKKKAVQKENPRKELLEHEELERLDIGAPTTPVGVDQDMETLATVNRTEDS